MKKNKELYIEPNNWVTNKGVELSTEQIAEIVEKCKGCAIHEGWQPCYSHCIILKSQK